MTDEREINIAIAEAVGEKCHKPTPEELASGSYYQYEPNYCGDLNLMHEAEKTIDASLWSDYTVQLRRIIQRDCDTEAHYVPGWAERIADIWFYGATARQRAEAFLRVKGLWK